MKLAVLAVGILGASGAVAQENRSAAEAGVLSAFSRCRAIADDTARLACFDTATTELSQAVERNDVVILDRQDVRETRRSLFGFNLPKLPFFRGGDDNEKEEFQEIDSSVTGLRSLGYDKFSVTIEGGAVWRTTEPVRKQPRVGDKIRIKRGAIGSYFMSFDDGRAVKGMRVN